MSYQVHLTLKSRNEKVGPIPVSTTSAKTCPSDCPFKKSGCYADGGPLALFWGKVTREDAGTDWDSFCGQVKALPEGQLWRHNQAGDLPGNGKEIDHDALMALVSANEGRKGFTYTHYNPIGYNKDNDALMNALCIAKANEGGFTVNMSGNNLKHADQLAALKIGPVVCVVPEDHPEHSTTPEGRKVVVCPEQTGKAKSCAECKLCQKVDRAVIVAFRAHGVSKRKAIAIAQA
jgi:hypothetical protein